MQRSHERGSYMSQFLHLKCAGDVLNALGHPTHQPEREIVRAMACLRILRPGVRPPRAATPGVTWAHEASTNSRSSGRENGPKPLAPVRLVELGPRNAALAILAAHVLPYKEIVVISEEVPNGLRLDEVARLRWRRGNIHEGWIEKHLHDFDTPVVLASAHATPADAERAVQLYKHVPNVEQVVLLLDAWNGTNGVRSKLLAKEMGRSTAWAVEQAIGLHADVFRDAYIPKGMGPRVMLHARSRLHASAMSPRPVPVTIEEHDGE